MWNWMVVVVFASVSPCCAPVDKSDYFSSIWYALKITLLKSSSSFCLSALNRNSARPQQFYVSGVIKTGARVTIPLVSDAMSFNHLHNER